VAETFVVAESLVVVVTEIFVVVGGVGHTADEEAAVLQTAEERAATYAVSEHCC
jgi:hypothetical protein